MKIKKSTVEELIKTNEEWLESGYDEDYDAYETYEETRRFASKQIFGDEGIEEGKYAIGELLHVANLFNKHNFETVAALFEALGVEVCDD